MTVLALYPHQHDSVAYLKSRRSHALLWDEQRVGKTAPVIVASGELGLRSVLIVTPVAGVGVWKHQWPLWDKWGRTPVIIPWSQMVSRSPAVERLLTAHYDLIVLDEGHYAKNFDAARTRRVYGILRGRVLDQAQAVIARGARVWHLTGTPAPHDPGDLFSVLLALFPQVLEPSRDFPDVTTFDKFRTRYCVIANRLINGRMIKVVLRGQNTQELNRRLKGLFLRRRQSDVGIKPAFWDLLPVELTPYERARMFAAIDEDALRRLLAKGPAAAFTDAEQMLAPVRRITGAHKAKAVVADAVDFLGNTPGEKLVISYWHKEVGDVLEHGLAKFGPTRVDGSITGDHRTQKVSRFQSDPACRVFVAQIAACGEAIDLSAASEMWFAESTFTPSQMAQMGARITNLNQRRQCLVRVAALEDSIDEMVQTRLIDLSRSIAHTLGEDYHENFAARRV